MILRSIALALLVLLAPVMGASSKTVICVQGERVPGGADSESWVNFSEPYIDKEGGLHVHAGTSHRERLIYRSFGGEIVTRAAEGQPVSAQNGASSKMLLFPVGHRAVRAASGGAFVMYAHVFGAGLSDAGWNAIVHGDAAGLHIVAHLGGAIPGTSQPIAAFASSVRLDAQGNVLFGARATNETKMRVLRWSPSGVDTIWPNLNSLPDFIPYEWQPSASGEIVLRGSFSSGSKAALVKWTPHGETVIARSGDPIPGRPGETYGSFFSGYSCNAAGDVFFGAASRSGTSSYVDRMWFARPNGAIERVVDGSFTSAVVNSLGDVAYYSGGFRLKRAGDEVQTIVGSSAFQYRLSLDALGGIVFQTSEGIWFRGANKDAVSVARIGETIAYGGSEYRISEVRLTSFLSGGDDGLPRASNEWGQIALAATLSKTSAQGKTTNLNALILATVPGGGVPGKKPEANMDRVFFRSGAGVAVKLDVVANDVSPAGANLKIDSFTQGAFGKVSVRDGMVYYTPSNLFTIEDSFYYTASNGWGLSEETLVVVRNPYSFNNGLYEMPVVDGSAVVGKAGITLSKAGRITGRIQYGERLLRLSGAFNGDMYLQSFTLDDGETVTVSLQLESPPGSAVVISGSIVSSSGATFGITRATRFGLPPGTKAMKVTGQFRTDGEISLQRGIGFFVATLSPSGTFIARGRLPDEQPFSTSSRMKVDGSLAFDCSPYGRGRGGIRGVFVKGYAGTGLHRWDAALRWTRNAAVSSGYPDAVDASVTALMATYAPTPQAPAISSNPSTATGMITAELGGELLLRETFSWSQRDTVVFTPPNPNRLQLRVNRGSGMLSGSYINSPQELRRFSGVIFAIGNGAVGLVSDGEATGSFILYAN